MQEQIRSGIIWLLTNQDEFLFNFRDNKNIHSPIQLTTRIAFTLAEVLIVLGIIGIIAEITIPTVVQNVTDTILVAQAKETYALYQQFFLSYKADTGGEPNNIINPVISGDIVNDTVAKYLRVLKKCTKYQTGCGSQYYKSADGSQNWNLPYYYWVVLANGATIGFNPYSSGDATCNTPFPFPDVDADGNPVDTNGDGDPSNDFHNVYDQQCGAIIIDVNGMKGPNQMDHDAYWLIVVPYGNIKYWDYRSDINYVISNSKLPPTNSYDE